MIGGRAVGRWERRAPCVRKLEVSRIVRRRTAIARRREARRAREAPLPQLWQRPAAMKPGPRQPTIACRWGIGCVWYVIDCPEARTPAWWAAKVGGCSFRLEAHPVGIGGKGRDAAWGLRQRQDLGQWSGPSLPVVPIGVPAAAVWLQGPAGRCQAAALDAPAPDGTPLYAPSPAAWAAMAPVRQATTPAEIYVEEMGRRRVFARGTVIDGLTTYVPKRPS